MNKSGAPPGWDYNPSSWLRRVPVLLGCLMGLILLSDTPAPSPLHSALFLFFAYAFVTESIGGARRWRTHPWTVGLSVLGLSLMLWSLTRSVYASVSPNHSGPSLRVISAHALAVLMIGPLAGELLASLQFLKRLHRQRRSAWRAFWGLDPRRTRHVENWSSPTSEPEH